MNGHEITQPFCVFIEQQQSVDNTAENKSEEVNSYMQKSFRQIYQYFGFATDQSVWYYFRKWLVDGYLSFEIIYSPDQKEIIGFKEISLSFKKDLRVEREGLIASHRRPSAVSPSSYLIEYRGYRALVVSMCVITLR